MTTLAHTHTAVGNSSRPEEEEEEEEVEVRGHSCPEPLARERSWCLHADTAPQCKFPRQRSATHVGAGCDLSEIATDVLFAKL